MSRKVRATFPSLAYLALTLAGMRKVLFAPGVIGHHWDWAWPVSTLQAINMLKTQLSAWAPFGMGSYIRFRYGSALPLTLLGVPSAIGVSPLITQRLLLVGVTLLAALGMRRLVLESFPQLSPIAAWVAGLSYGLAPYHYNQVIAGDVLGLVAYGLAPFFVRALAVVITSPSFAATGRVALFGVFVASSSIHIFLVSSLVAGIWLTTKFGPLAVFRRVMPSAMLFVLCNLFWILPLVTAPEQSGLHATTMDLSYLPATLARFDSLQNALTGASYWTPFYLGSLGVLRVPWSTLISVLAVAACVCALILPKKPGTKVWGLMFLFGALLSASGSALGEVSQWLYRYSFWRFLFRTPQHLVFITAFTLPLTICSGVMAMGWRIRRDKLQILTFSLLALLPLGFLLDGGFQGYIGPFRITTAETEIQKILKRDKEAEGSILPFPAGVSRLFDNEKIRNIDEEAGDDGALIWSPLPVITSELKWSPNASARWIQRLVSDGVLREPSKAGSLLNLVGAKYVLLTPAFSPTAGPLYKRWDGRSAAQIISSSPDLRLLYERDGWMLWENKIFTGRLEYQSNPIRASQATPISLVASVVSGNTLIVPEGVGRGPRGVIIRPSANGAPGPDSKEHIPGLEPMDRGSRFQRLRGGFAFFPADAEDAVVTLPIPGAASAILRSERGVVEFSAKSDIAVELLVWLEGEGGGRYETRVDVGTKLHAYRLAIDEMVPVGDIRGASVDRIRFATVISRASVTILGPAIRGMKEETNSVTLSGFFEGKPQPPHVWNYFDPYPEMAFVRSPAFSGQARLSSYFEVEGGAYEISLAFVMGPDAPDIIVSVDDQTHFATQLSGPIRSIDILRVGQVNLTPGKHRVTIESECPDLAACDLAIFEVLVLPKQSAGPSQTVVGRGIGEDEYSIALGDSDGIVLLKQAFDEGWMTSPPLTHFALGRALNSWASQDGVTRVKISYGPNSAYRALLVVSWSILGVLILALATETLRRKRRQ